MHGAIGAFLCEIPATSRFSVSFETFWKSGYITMWPQPKVPLKNRKRRCHRPRLNAIGKDWRGSRRNQKHNQICHHLLPTRNQERLKGYLHPPSLPHLKLAARKLQTKQACNSIPHMVLSQHRPPLQTELNTSCIESTTQMGEGEK